MKKLSFLLLVLLSVNTFALTEDYILYSRTEVASQQREMKAKQEAKVLLCEKYSLSKNIKESCLITKKSNDLIKACLNGTDSQVSQSYCLISKNISADMVSSCYENTSSEKSEVACLVLSNKKVVKTETKINSCAGLGATEEIICMKFNN